MVRFGDGVVFRGKESLSLEGKPGIMRNFRGI
jgi:hypothetical protein